MINNPPANDELELSLSDVQEILYEIEHQPSWRSTADKEMDYADGNQLDSDLLKRMQEIGIPPAVENLIGPAIRAIEGFETSMRTDWRVTANGEPGGQDVADALNFKLNQAEKQSKADKACSNAFRRQICCGIGWVEVKRESNPLDYPYRCTAINRNEIHWDMKSQEDDLSDARWLRRKRWVHPQRLKVSFSNHRELIERIGQHGSSWSDREDFLDGGQSTNLSNAWANQRAWSLEEEYWYNPSSKEILVSEYWYRRWVEVIMLRFNDGRIVEFDDNNPAHLYAAANGHAIPERATVARVRRAYWIGPHQLHDSPSPYPHKHFPYVPFFAFREDNTRIPFGFIRDMKYPQDLVNSTQAKIRWGMSSVRVTATKGATNLTPMQVRQQIARPDSYIELNKQHMAQAGARFDVERDFELNQHQFQLLQDGRQAIERTSSITSGFQGKQGTATSGKQESIQVEQSDRSMQKVMDNFRESRTLVGEQLIALVIEDLGQKEEVVIIEGDAVTAERKVHINKPEVDALGYSYLSNDVQRTRLMVALSDVPSSKSFMEQQMRALSEITKSLPANIQVAILPYIIALTDTPFKKEVIQAIKEASQAPTPEQIQQQIQEAVKRALADAGNDIKLRELELKEKEMGSRIRNTDAKTVQTGVQSSYSAMQGAAQVAQMPQIAPIADEIMKGAGYQRPNPMGDDPNFPTAEQTAASDIRSPYIQGQGAEIGSEGLAEVQQNTSPMSPPVPQEGSSPMKGIETQRVSDNI